MPDQEPTNAYAPPAETRAEASNGPIERAWRRFSHALVPVLLISLVTSGVMTTWRELNVDAAPKAELREMKALSEEMQRAAERHVPPEEMKELQKQQVELAGRMAANWARTLAKQAVTAFGANLVTTFAVLLTMLVVLVREGTLTWKRLSARLALRLALAAVLLWSLEFLGALACVVPGIVVGIADSFVAVLMLMEDLGPWRALKRSFVLTWRGGASVLVPGVVIALLSFAGAGLSGSFRAEHRELAIAVEALVSFVFEPAVALRWLSFWEEAREAEAPLEAAAVAT